MKMTICQLRRRLLAPVLFAALSAGGLSTHAQTALLTVSSSSSVTITTNVPVPASSGTIYVLQKAAHGSLVLQGQITGGAGSTLRTTTDTAGDTSTIMEFAATNSSYTGNIQLYRGSVLVDNPLALGTGTINGDANNGATGDLLFNANMTFTNPLVMQSATSLSSSNYNVVMSGPISGAYALTTYGAGTLTLAGHNTYSGMTAVASGTLALANATNSSGSPLNIYPGASVNYNGTLYLAANSTNTTLAVTNAGTLNLTSTTNNVANPDIFSEFNQAGTADYGVRVSSAINLGSAQRYIWSKGGRNDVARYGLTGCDCQLAGPISGAGGITVTGLTSFASSYHELEVPFAFTATNTFTGTLEILRGSVYCGSTGAFACGTNVLLLDPNPASTNCARFFLYGFNTSVGNLQSTGIGANCVIADGNGPTTANEGPATLTVNESTGTTFNGSFYDWYQEYAVPTAGSQNNVLSLVVSGPGILTLTGLSTHSGSTTVSNGTLNLVSPGAFAKSPVTIASNGTLAGNGILGGAVTNLAGGTLTLGTNIISTLTFSNYLTLATGSTNIFKLSKTGGIATNDQFTGISTATLGGMLIVSNITSDGTLLALNDSFKLISAGGYAGTFATTNLPSLPAGLAWDVTQLPVSGTIRVVQLGTVSTPIISPAGGNFLTPQTVTISSATAGATIYYTTDGTTPTISSPSGITPVTLTVLASSPAQTVSAFAAKTGSITSPVATANFSILGYIWTNTISGNWSGTTNWLYGSVANGSATNAYFNTLTLAGDTYVTNDVAPTIGQMVFADVGNAHNWIVADGGAGPITLDNGGAAPVLTVSNQTTTINTSLAGTAGLIKNGSGTLVLGAATNTYLGTTLINSGTLVVGNVSTWFSGSTQLSSFSIATNAVLKSVGTLSLNAGTSAQSVGVSGTGVLQLAGTTNSDASPDIYFNANDLLNVNSTANDGSRIAAPINLGSVQRYIWGATDHNGVGQYGLNGTDCQFAGPISGSGGLTFIALDENTSSSPMQVPFALNASNSFTGPVELRRGAIYLGAAGAFPAGDVLRFNVASGYKGYFFLYGQNASATDLSATNLGTASIANANGNPSAWGPATLTVTQNNAAIYNGTLVDTIAQYGVTSGTSASVLSFVKKGLATLSLTGKNTYSGTTTVSAGKLVISSASTITNTVTIADGASLGVTVSGASQLAPVTLLEGTTNGPTTNEFTGLISTTVAPVTVSNLTLKGTTTINILGGTYASGQIYPLIAFTNITGAGSFVLGTTPVNLVASVVTNGNAIVLNVTTGNIMNWNGLVDGTWDIGSTANWSLNGVTGKNYFDPSPVVLDDSAAGTTAVNLAATVSPISVTVSNSAKAYTIGGSQISGTTGLSKYGNNSLTLNGVNTFTGNLVINAGSVIVGTSGVLGGGLGGAYPGTITDNGSLVYASSVDQTNSGTLNGTGTLLQNGTDTLTLAANAPITGGITVSNGTLRVTTDNFGGRFTPSLITVETNGILFSDNYHALGYGTSVLLNQGTWVMNYEDYKTNIMMIDGQINGGPGGDGGQLRLGYQGTSYVTVTNSVVGSVINVAVNDYSGTNYLNVYRGLAASDLTINGAITSSGGTGGLTKNGDGILTLNGQNDTFTNSLTVNAGTLALGSGSVLVCPVNIQSGALLLLAPTNTAQVNIDNALTFAAGSTNILKIDKTGGTLMVDQIQGLTGVTYSGTLIITNITGDTNTFAAGDSVQLFSSTAYTGGFTKLVLPPLGIGLVWDVSQLAVNGQISVVNTVSPPAFNPPAGTYQTPQTVTISSLTPGATIYYTTDGSTPTTSSLSGITPVTITVLGTSPTETVSAYATHAGIPDSSISTVTYTLNSSTWTNLAGGNWSDSASWLYAIVPNGSASTAFFSALTLESDTTVTNDQNPTVGTLVFADAGNAHDWNLVDNGGGTITLDNGAATPVITVSNRTTTISTALGGSSGLYKNGSGTLTLAATNTYTGTTEVGAGTVDFLAPINTIAKSALVIDAGAVVLSSNTVNLNVAQNGSVPSVDIAGTGTLRLTATANGDSSPDLYFGPDHVSNDYWGTTENATLDLGALQRFIYGKTGHNGVGQYGVNKADCVFAGSIIGAGGLTIIAQNNWTGSNPMEAGFTLVASNSFAGPLEIQRGSVYLANANALSQTNVLFMNAGSGFNSRLFLYGHSVAVANLSSTANGNNLIANGNKLTGATVTNAAATLTVYQSAAGTYSGAIQDVQAEYDGTGTGTTGPLGITKAGTNALTLSGVNTYSGPTTVANGTLVVDGRIGSGNVTVQSGATLSGAGLIKGATTVQSGGTLAPGDSGLGTLTVSNALTLSAGSTTTLAINRTAGTGSFGSVAGLTSVSFGGTLTVTSQGGTFQAGDSFPLFNIGGTGNFTTLNLPALASGLGWSFNPATGVLSVISTGPAVFTGTIQFAGAPVLSGSTLSISASYNGTGAIYLLMGTNLTVPVSAWTPIWTNVVSGNGSFTTNLNGAVNASLPQQYFIFCSTNW